MSENVKTYFQVKGVPQQPPLAAGVVSTPAGAGASTHYLATEVLCPVTDRGVTSASRLPLAGLTTTPASWFAQDDVHVVVPLAPEGGKALTNAERYAGFGALLFALIQYPFSTQELVVDSECSTVCVFLVLQAVICKRAA